MFGFKKELYTPEYQLAGDECAVIETSKGTIKVKFDGEGAPIARSMDPDSAGSQFYFCLGAQHNLDSGYTVFGTTVEGLDVISQLRAGDEIVHVEIVHE